MKKLNFITAIAVAASLTLSTMPAYAIEDTSVSTFKKYSVCDGNFTCETIYSDAYMPVANTSLYSAEAATSSTESVNWDSYSIDWAYNDFALRDNSDEKQNFYEYLDKICKEFYDSGTDIEPYTLNSETTIYMLSEINVTSFGLTIDEAIEVYYTFKFDNPMYYWVSNELFTSSTSFPKKREYILLVCNEEFAENSARQEMTETIISGIDEYCDAVSGLVTNYEKAKTVYEKLIETVSYAYDENGNALSDGYTHCIAGVFDESHQAVCEGYAMAYSIIMNYIGVHCITVKGNSISNGNSSGHAWNIIQMDDENYYWADITWDDKGSYSNNYYFLQADSVFSQTHQPFTSDGTGFYFQYDLPEAQDKKYTLSNANDDFQAETTVTTTVTTTNEATAVTTTETDVTTEITTETTAETTLTNNAVYTVTFFDYEGNEIDVQTVSVGEAAKIPEAPEKAYYIFIGWDSDVSSVTQNMKVYPIYEILKGDVDGNSKVSSMDIIAMKNYLLSKISLSSEAMLAADIDSNENVDIIDAILLTRTLIKM